MRLLTWKSTDLFGMPYNELLNNGSIWQLYDKYIN